MKEEKKKKMSVKKECDILEICNLICPCCYIIIAIIVIILIALLPVLVNKYLLAMYKGKFK